MKQRVITPNPIPDMPLATLDRSAVEDVSTPLPVAMSRSEIPAIQTHHETEIKAIQKIALSRLKIHPFNSRTIRTQKRIEEVRDMLDAMHTQREAITVVPGRRPDDRDFFYILSGQTRFHAANLAGWSELDAQINSEIDPDNHVEFWGASIEHNTSIPETDWDLAIKVKALVEEGIATEVIQKAARRDARGLRRLAAMTELPESVLGYVRNAPEKLTAAFCELLRSALESLGESDTVSLAKTAVESDLSKRELDDQIKLAKRRKTAASPERQKRATRDLMTPIMVAGGKAGEFKIMKSRTEGHKQISLTANLPESLVEVFKADIQIALRKLSETHGDA